VGGHVTRFASDPSKAEKFGTGWSGSGLGIDNQGNVWVTNRFGSSMRGGLLVANMILTLKTGGNADEVLTRAMAKQTGRHDGGSITLLRPDGTEYPGSPFMGGGLPGPWAATIDGNDNVWISNFAGPNSPITQLCGVRTENCPPGFVLLPSARCETRRQQLASSGCNSRRRPGNERHPIWRRRDLDRRGGRAEGRTRLARHPCRCESRREKLHAAAKLAKLAGTLRPSTDNARRLASLQARRLAARADRCADW